MGGSRASVVGLPPPRLFDKDRDWKRDFLMTPAIYQTFIQCHKNAYNLFSKVYH